MPGLGDDFERTVTLAANYITLDQYPAFRQLGEAVDSRDRLPISGAARP